MMHGNIIVANILLFCCGYSIYYFVAVIFVLYLLHIHVVKYTHKVLDITNSWAIYFIVVLIISIMLVELIKRLVPSRYHYCLGIY